MIFQKELSGDVGPDSIPITPLSKRPITFACHTTYTEQDVLAKGINIGTKVMIEGVKGKREVISTIKGRIWVKGVKGSFSLKMVTKA